MQRETDIIIAGTVCVLLFGLLSSFLIKNRPIAVAEEWQGTWACAADTLECPDGTLVSRVPPYCLFAACAGQ
jgi:hypothetical protein